MEIGAFIKLQRIKQEMTQEELAQGIVSMSYLSKIENQKTEASPEVISMLCTRLGIQLDGGNDLTIKEKCEAWYNSLFEVNDKQEIIRNFRELEELLSLVRSENLTMFEIHKIRYYLVLGELDQALEQINKLDELVNSFDNLEKYYWYKFKGNYNSVTGQFNQAMRMYRHAEEKQMNQLNLKELEVADLQYIIAVTHSKLRNTLEAIEYANKAIEIFRKEYNFIRCAQCHIILGISYRRIKMYDKAIKNHNLAKHLGELNKNKMVIQLANQNLGYLHSTKGEIKEAIHYFEEVAKDKEVNINERLLAITSLIKEYYNINNIEKSRVMIDKAIELLDKNNVFYTLFYYIIHTYKYALNGEYEKFQKLVAEEFIPFLKKQKDYGNLVVYAKMLGQHYEKQGRYKDSVKYYKLANLTYENVVNL